MLPTVLLLLDSRVVVLYAAGVNHDLCSATVLNDLLSVLCVVSVYRGKKKCTGT